MFKYLIRQKDSITDKYFKMSFYTLKSIKIRFIKCSSLEVNRSLC